MRLPPTLASGVGHDRRARYSQGMHCRRMKRWIRSGVAGIVAVAGACETPRAIAWEEIRTVPLAIDDGARLVIGGDAGAALLPSIGSAVPIDGPVCAGSVRVAGDGQGGVFAAWWEPRADSSVTLMVARRAIADSGAWAAPVVADARDRGRGGCGRPAPGIAADAARGYVHLAYHLDAPTGAGVYGGHSMESGTFFHDPVPVVFGDRPVAASVATSGDIVAVAYEDPNSARSRIMVALSLTAGHLYEHRLEASPSTMRATNPRVAVDGRRVAVAWVAEEWEQGARGSRTMMRVGAIAADARPGSGGNEQ